MINTAMELEHSYINTNHPDFIGLNLIHDGGDKADVKKGDFDDYKPNKKRDHQKGGGGIFSFLGFGSSSNSQEQAPEPPKPKSYSLDEFEASELTEREKKQIVILRKLLESYVSISKKNLQDQVTKIIMMVLVKGTVKDLKRELTNRLYKGDGGDYSELLSESEDIEIKRAMCKKELEALHESIRILQECENIDLHD
eukprot:TRINITY_DN5474_c0_g1_i4.p2 TRINITY_DN5474_c0_g1~~TRINITY_DN5474_c0_g1_i4.p2  ORF type:complete len:197 (-),score=59.61 TRINITY_DN5474_c0_g1_i4:153-743(-)